MTRIIRSTNYKSFCYLIGFLATFSSGLMLGIIMKWDSIQCNQQINKLSKDIPIEPIHQLISIEKTYLVIVIFSAFSNEERRHAIRETWIRLALNRKYKHYFIVGTLDLNQNELNAIYSEQRIHNDLILFPHLKDTYSSLSHKLLSTLKWFSNKIEFKYLLKVDDDSFVQIDQLFDELLEKSLTKTDSKPLYWGYFDGRAHVKRKGQWSESNWILCDRYLPYALGGGYIISKELVDFVAQNAPLLQLYRNEDVSLGVWLSSLSINRIHDIRFDTEYQSRGCINSHLITHKQSADNMRILYKNLQTFGKLCKNEIELQYSYVYNWKALPSQCCIRNITIKTI